jgi:hypothetical protein
MGERAGRRRGEIVSAFLFDQVLPTAVDRSAIEGMLR